MGQSAFYCANHRVFCKFQQPAGWRIHRFFCWKMPFTVFRSGSGASELSGQHSGEIPESPRKRSQSFTWNSPREYGWEPPPNPKKSRRLRPPEHFQNSLPPPQYDWGPLFSQKWIRRGPLRTGHGIPSSTEGISVVEELCVGDVLQTDLMCVANLSNWMISCSSEDLSENGKGPGNRGFKKSAELGHRSSALSDCTKTQ